LACEWIGLLDHDDDSVAAGTGVQGLEALQCHNNEIILDRPQCLSDLYGEQVLEVGLGLVV
jgi:hypothetical protein